MNEELNTGVEEEEVTIDLGVLLRALWKKLWLIILVAVIGGGAAFGYTKFLVTPQYQSSAMIYVLAKTTSISTTFNLSLNQQLTTDFVILAKTRPVIEDVIKELNLNATYEELSRTVSVSNLSDSSILQITATNPDPVLAADIANQLANNVADQVATVMVTDRPSTMEKAVPADRPVSPSMKKNVAIGALLGAFLVAGIIVILTLLDDTVKTPDDVKKRLNAPVLASFPLEKRTKSARKA